MAKLDSGTIYCNIDELDKIQEHLNKVDEYIENLFKDSPKRGKCTLTKLEGKNNDKYVLGMQRTGYCPGIKVGYGCKVENNTRWFITSVVQDIDWEKGIFHTLNSTYKFEFHED